MERLDHSENGPKIQSMKETRVFHKVIFVMESNINLPVLYNIKDHKRKNNARALEKARFFIYRKE
jgi:hypothetical protein